MSELRGVTPELPGFLAESPAWTTPIRAERVDVWRVAVGLAVLYAVFVVELPSWAHLYGPVAWAPPRDPGAPTPWLQAPWVALAALPASLWLGAMAVGGVQLTLGWWPRAGAALAWVATVALATQRPWVAYGSDTIQTAMLFYAMVAPVGDGRIGGRDGAPAWVHPWLVQVLLVHLSVGYFATGVSKLSGAPWRDGTANAWIFHNPTWARFPWLGDLLPEPLLMVGTYVVLAWELTFPVLVLRPATRRLAFALGIAFHVLTVLGVRVGSFSAFMLCFYVPFLPWERLVDRWRAGAQKR